MVTDLVPELLTSHQRAQLVLGLRARVRKCRSDYEQLALLDVFCFHNVFFLICNYSSNQCLLHCFGVIILYCFYII